MPEPAVPDLRIAACEFLAAHDEVEDMVTGRPGVTMEQHSEAVGRLEAADGALRAALAGGGTPDEPGDDDLTELRRLHRTAQPTPWYVADNGGLYDADGERIRTITTQQRFIEAAVNALPGLLAEVERLRAEPGDDDTAAIRTALRLWHQGGIDAVIRHIEELTAAILDIDAHATPLSQDEDGFVAGGYAVTVGALHRALGKVGHAAAKCGPGSLCDTCTDEVERLRAATPASEDDEGLFMLDLWLALGRDGDEFDQAQRVKPPAQLWSDLLAKVVALRNGGIDG